MKKISIFLMLMAFFAPLAMVGQETLTVCDGTNTNNYVPIYGLYCDEGVKCEYVIPASELEDMANGTITSMKFYLKTTGATAAISPKFTVFLKEVDFTTMTAYTGTTGATTVFSNTIAFTTNATDGTEVEIQFADDYSYGGGNLLIGFYQDGTSGYNSTTWYGVTQTDNTAWRGYGSSSGSAQKFLPKTTFTYTAGEAPACAKPRGLAVNYTGGNTAEVSWTSEATTWNIDVNGTVTAITENPYTLTGLNMATTYEVKVQANCGNDELSEWTSAASFTTDLCMPEDMCEITIELTDAYGDGGGKIEVVDVLTNAVLGTYTNSSASTTYNLAVCDGRTINFVFTATDSWSYENGYVFTDVNGEIIAQHEGCASSGNCEAPTAGVVATYTVSCAEATCHQPADLTVTPAGTSAVISWTDEEASAWQICVNDNEDNIIDVTENPYTLDGLTVSTAYTVKVRANCGDDDFSSWTPNVSFTTMECDDFCEISYVLTANAYQSSYSYGWYYSGIKVFDARTDEQIDFWTVPYGGSEGTVTGTLALCHGKEIYFQWYTYYSTANDNILVGGYTIYDVKGDVIAENNGPMSEDVEYTMDCTIPSCMWPNNFAVEPSYTSAAISWEGSADSYNVKYRTAPVLFYEGFEYGLDAQGWTSIANGDVPSAEEFANGWACDGSDAHTGVKSAASRSWYSQVALSADNYLITPQLELKGTLNFWVKCSYPSDADEYEVLLSTGGTAIRDFNVILQDITAATGDWQPVEIDLSRYEGRRGYIAIHHVYENGELLFVDDFMLLGDDQDAGRWVETSSEETSIVLTNLEMDTWYEYLVQSVCNDREVSEWRGGEFQTLNGNEKQFNADGNWDIDANWTPEGIPTANQNVTINAAVTIPENYVAVANSVTLGTDGSILIKDGAELQFEVGEDITATIEKAIAGYTGLKDNYYLISSPIGAVESTEVEGLLTGQYDYYSFDATEDDEWRNYRVQTFNMANGLGYLYANGNSDGTILSFTGDLLEPSYYYAGGSGSYYLTYDESYDFGTFNLLGNVYARKGYLYYYNSDNSWVDITDFYVMGDGILEPNTNPYLMPCEGAFVEATQSSQRVLVATQPYATRNAVNSALNMTITSSNKLVDRALIRFGEGRGLKKFQLDRNSSRLYMPVDGNDYAVVYTENQGEMPVSFKAEENGNYTLSINTENVELGYLHLIDNMTGNDVDLLSTPSYSFEAKTTDYANRFMLVFSTNVEDNFAFMSNGNLIINNDGNATVQVIDINGRVINSTSINGSASLNMNAANGVYVIRLINGENVKVQKVVVR